jgi:hypothetical protein
VCYDNAFVDLLCGFGWLEIIHNTQVCPRMFQTRFGRIHNQVGIVVMDLINYNLVELRKFLTHNLPRDIALGLDIEVTFLRVDIFF